MAVITGNWGYDAICITTAILAIFYTFLKWSHAYWQRRKVWALPPSLPFGNATNIFLQKITMSDAIRNAYDIFKSKGLKHGGFYFFAKPIYVPVDPEIVKHIMQKDFQHFINHGVYFNEKDDPLSANLFALEDTKWRNLRAKLTPTFTSGRMKAMFQTLVDCTKELTILMDDSSKGRTPVNIKEVMGRFTTDIIGSCAFGIECNSLKDPDAEFRRNGKKVFEVDFVEAFKQFLQFSLPRSFLNKAGLKVFNSDVAKFFTQAVKETVEFRENNNVYRKDFMHLLLQLKNRGKLSDDDKILGEEGATKTVSLTLSELTAQAFVFFLAGFETSSTTMSFALYELAVNQQVQQKLREEIKRVLAKHDNQVTYEAVMEMDYMDKVINETLRKYPPGGLLARVCNSDYKVPGTDLVLEKGTQVFIPVMGFQHDPEYYPEPNLFKPERFTTENINKRPAFTFLPFGEGPRICIGQRFGVMQSKVGLLALLRDYKVTLNEKTISPLQMDPIALVTSAKGGIWINVVKLN